MSGEATTKELSPNDVDLDAILRGGPSQEAANEQAGERSDDSPEQGGEPTDQGKGANETVAQYELRLRNLQAAKDREIAQINRDREELRRATEIYEQTLLELAVEQARQRGGEPAAQQVQNHYQLTRQQQQIQSREQALQQAYLAQQAEAAQLLAWRLASDPKFEGVEANELMKWARYGPEAMVQAAENLALGKRAQNITTRKQNKTDNMGGGSGGATDVTSTMQGSDLITFALNNSKRGNRWE